MILHPKSRYQDNPVSFHTQGQCRKFISAAGAQSLQAHAGEAATTLSSAIIFAIKVAVTGPAVKQATRAIRSSGRTRSLDHPESHCTHPL